MADFNDDDDFCDLYADVEAQASSAINSVLDTTRLCVVEPEEGDKFYAVTPSAELGFTSELRKSSCVEEGGSRSGNGDLGRRGLGLEENGDIGVNVVDNGSDSEDDLNIVLNDDDCKFLEGPRKGGVDGGVGFNADEDQKPDVGIVLTNGNGSSKKCDQDDQLVEGLEQNHNIQIGNDRRNGVKVNPNQHYKYIRNHRPLFPSSMTPDGSTDVAAFPSMSTRCDWEDNRYSLQQGSASGLVSRTYAKANASLGQSGYGFWLPRHRTILDINIDTFEEKPWRYPGVDITDFFNFGFNEDGWKLYCNSLEHHRQQSSTRIPGYESFKFNQVYGAGSMHEKVFQEAWSKDPQIGPGRTASASKSNDGKGRQSELPKGRAIEVEDSSGDRLPSMDMKCPNVWYSDVVIEIKVQDSAEEFSGLGNKELGHTDSKEQEKPENRVDKQVHRCDSASGDDHSIESGEGNVTKLDRSIATALTFVSLNSDNLGNGCLSNVDIHSHAKVDACTSAQIAETMEIEKTTNDEVCRDTCDAYPCLLEAALSLEDQSLSSPALSSIGSDSEVSKGCINSSPGDIDNSLKRPPSDSGTELWESVASDYNRPKNGAKMNIGDSKGYYSRNRKPIRKERNNPSGKPCNVAELKVQTENGDESIPMPDTKAFGDRGNKSFDCRRQKGGQRKFDYDGNQNFSHRETELSCGYGSEFCTKDHFHTGYTNYPRRIVHQSFRDKMVQYIEKDWCEFPHEQRNARMDGEDVKNGRLCGGRGFSTGDMSPVTYVKRRNIKWRRKTEKQQLQEEAGHGVTRLQETHYERQRYERHLQSSGRGSQNLGGRGRYRNIPPLDLGCSLSTEYGDEHWGISDHQLLSSRSYRESHIAVGRSHHNRPQEHAVYASRSTKISGRCRRQVCAEEGREIDWHMNYNKSHPVNRLHLGRGRYNRHSEVLHWSDDKTISRQPDSELYAAEELFLRGKNSENWEICAQSGTVIDEMLIDDVQLEQHKYGKKIREVNNANYFSRSSNTKYTDKNEQTGQICRDSIDLVVGEGKLSRRYSAGRSPKDCGASHKVETVSNPCKVREKWLDKFAVAEQDQDLEIEEGQIVTDEPQEENQRISQTLAKMEKRRARFNEPISQKKETDSIPKADFTEENKQQRPTRKRRWGGN